MNTMKTLIAASLLICNFTLIAQTNNDPVLLTIAGKKITKSEFENVYRKNNTSQPNDREAINEYLELFINFKMKVMEAEEMGLDTAEAFRNELKGYRKQLSQPYLTDSEVTEALIREAYERLKTDVSASHILIKLNENASPKDTLEAYNKIMSIRNRILKGEDFAKLALAYSEDPSVKENNGSLGYFTALQMVYPFENAAYNTPVGEVSMPVRTRYGYHILKIHDRRPARGEILTAHIMVRLAPGFSAEDSASSKQRINEIYAKLLEGSDFAEMARAHSDDKNSARKGGELPWFGTGRMVPEFENAAFALQKNGDISEPIMTRFGWHIIKRIDKKDIAPFEEMKTELKNRIAKDSRSEKSREALIERIKKEYKFKEDKKAKKDFVKLIDKTYFEGNWSKDKAAKLKKTMFTLGDKKYTQQDFAAFLETRQSATEEIPAEVIIDRMYKTFVEENCIAHEESQLEKKYPEFRALMQEYRDGILLFELTDRKVWSKALKDTAGLEEFYQKNHNRYMWDERLEASIYYCANTDIANKLRKMLTDTKKQHTDEDLLKTLNTNSQLNLKIENGRYLRHENNIIDKIKWEPGLSENIKNENQIAIVKVHNKLPPEPKTLKEARGLVTADYQALLEQEWIEALRKKYSYSVNKEVLGTIK